eukprot:286150_1
MIGSIDVNKRGYQLSPKFSRSEKSFGTHHTDFTDPSQSSFDYSVYGIGSRSGGGKTHSHVSAFSSVGELKAILKKNDLIREERRRRTREIRQKRQQQLLREQEQREQQQNQKPQQHHLNYELPSPSELGIHISTQGADDEQIDFVQSPTEVDQQKLLQTVPEQKIIIKLDDKDELQMIDFGNVNNNNNNTKETLSNLMVATTTITTTTGKNDNDELSEITHSQSEKSLLENNNINGNEEASSPTNKPKLEKKNSMKNMVKGYVTKPISKVFKKVWKKVKPLFTIKKTQKVDLEIAKGNLC